MDFKAPSAKQRLFYAAHRVKQYWDTETKITMGVWYTKQYEEKGGIHEYWNLQNAIGRYIFTEYVFDKNICYSIRA